MTLLSDLRGDLRRHDNKLTNPAVWALTAFRLGNRAKSLPPGARIIAEKACSAFRIGVEAATGIALYPGTDIGKDVHIIHAANIRIHPDAVIGARVGIMHDVTIGSSDVEGLPIIEDDVFIGPGAKILGPVTIGQGARIAANSLVITDIPAGATALGVPARPLPKKRPRRNADPEA